MQLKSAWIVVIVVAFAFAASAFLPLKSEMKSYFMETGHH